MASSPARKWTKLVDHRDVFPFFELPREIRDCIYGNLFVSRKLPLPSIRIAAVAAVAVNTIAPHVRLVSRQLKHECDESAFGESSVQIQCREILSTELTNDELLVTANITPWIGKMVTSMELSCLVIDNINRPSVLGHYIATKCVERYSDHFGVWRDDFPYLRDLYVKLYVLWGHDVASYATHLQKAIDEFLVGRSGATSVEVYIVLPGPDFDFQMSYDRWFVWSIEHGWRSNERVAKPTIAELRSAIFSS